MIIIGVTGSIGMGKSTITNMLNKLRIPVFDSDKEVKNILDNNNNVINKIYKLWPNVIQFSKTDKHVNKNALSKKMFNEKKNRKILENILHPLVQKKRDFFIQTKNKSFIIALDVPLLYETGADKICDEIFLVYTNENIQKDRVLAREGMTEKKFYQIKQAQWSTEIKMKKKPYLVTTSYGKLLSFILIVSFLIKIIFEKKVLKI